MNYAQGFKCFTYFYTCREENSSTDALASAQLGFDAVFAEF